MFNNFYVLIFYEMKEKNYKHIIYEERIIIETLLQQDYSQTKIAEHLDRSKSTISREIDRHWWMKNYKANKAEESYKKKRSDSNKRMMKIFWDKELQCMIISCIEEKWRAPAVIAWRWNLEQKEKKKEKTISHESIYTYLKKVQPDLLKHLPYGKKWYKKRNGEKKKWRLWAVNIKERSEIIDNRTRLGDWEIDTVYGKTKPALVTMVDRKSRYLVCWHVPDRKAETVKNALIEMMDFVPNEKLLTITSDNGKEFSERSSLENDLALSWFACDPYASYQRGTNEQTNGMIRKFLKKWTDFSFYEQDHIDDIVRQINHRPRKSLWRKTAHESFFEKSYVFFH